ncbi:VapE domain-containing protein [Brevundimonas sp. CEF1]|uniref:VapE domain-containing protein n=1 Tax=Brevundimonas sp. CEF1 TaxID=3442642 RepID=UPI003F517F88
MSSAKDDGRVTAADQSPMPGRREMLDAARRLIAAGVAVHWLHPRSKRPVGDEWSSAPVHTMESLTAAYRRNFNLGIRPGEHSRVAGGYLTLIDLDIRDAAQADDAWAALLERWPAARSAPFVVSGSGGESRHLYFVTDKPFRSKKLAKSVGYSMVFDARLGREVKKHDWEVELFGAPKQAVLPPSIHPDTGERYIWGREIEVDLLELGVGPIIPSDVVASWGVGEAAAADDDDDLMTMFRAEPMGLSAAEIDATLADLPEDWLMDRDCWYRVGMALHHEYVGDDAGFDRWCEWSRQVVEVDPNKFNMKDQEAVWKSFGKPNANPVRMASLIQAAATNRLAQAHDFMDDDGFDDVEDLLADEPSTAVALVPSVTPTPSDDIEDLLGPITASPITPGVSEATKPSPVEYDPEWKSFLQLNEEGHPKPTLHNVEIILRHDARLRGVIGFNEFTQEVVQVGTPKRQKLRKESPKPVRQLEGAIWRLRDPINGDHWKDAHDSDIRLILEAPDRQGGYGLKTSDRDLKAAVDKVSYLHAFHPIRDYLNGLEWDGQRRVATLFVDYVGAEDNPYHREAALLFLLGAVTRVFEPGHKFDFVPILEGVQGKRKSTFIRTLAKHWFAELEGDFHDAKGMVERMQGAWLLELAELSGFSKAEVTTIKGFISRQTDKVRMAYDRRATEFQRQCVFLGSTNETEYLRDNTGGRRFWPIACSVEEIDTDRLAGEVDQIWAEAKAMYDHMRQEHPTGTLPLYMKNPVAAAYAKDLQESRRELGGEDMLLGQIQAWLEEPVGSETGFDGHSGDDVVLRDEVCVLDIWVTMLGNMRGTASGRESREIGRALSRLSGWMALPTPRATKSWGNQRLYRRVTSLALPEAA